MSLATLEIKLSRSEYDYLCRALFLADEYRKLLFAGQRDGGSHVIQLSEDQADEMRDLCGEWLPVVGFDDKYELTPEGKLLESLVDKFFIG